MENKNNKSIEKRRNYMREYMQSRLSKNGKKIYCEVCNCYTSFQNIYRHRKSKAHFKCLNLSPEEVVKYQEDLINKRINKKKIRDIKQKIKGLKNEIKQYKN